MRSFLKPRKWTKTNIGSREMGLALLQLPTAEFCRFLMKLTEGVSLQRTESPGKEVWLAAMGTSLRTRMHHVI